MHCGKQKSKIPHPRLLPNCVSTLTLRKDSQKCDCFCLPTCRSLMLEWLDDSTLRGHVASISPTFN